MDEALMDECAGWIAAQLEEEGHFLDPGLVYAILEHEWGHPALGRLPHDRMAAELEASLAAAGVTGYPQPLSAGLIGLVLSWEDDFLSFAGLSRNPAARSQDHG